MADPSRTSLLAQVNSADTFGTGNYTPAGTFNLTRGKPVIVIGYGIGETDNGMRGFSLTCALSSGPTPQRIVFSDTSPAWSYGVAAWLVVPTADATGVSVTLGSGGLDAHSYSVAVDQLDNCDRAQIIGATTHGSTAAGGAATITLPKRPRRSSVVVGAACVGASAGSITVTPGSGFAEIADTNSAGWAGYEYQTRGNSVSEDVSWADLDAAGTAFGAGLIAFEIRGSEPYSPRIHWPTQWDWKPQRWDFPPDDTLLLDDLLPGSAAPSGAISGTASVSFTNSGNITGLAAISGAAAVTFTPTANVTGLAAISGAAAVSFAASANITGLASVSGQALVSFTPSGNITGTASLSGNAPVTFTASGNITGLASISGSALVTFTATGDVTVPGGGGSVAISGSAQVSFASSGNITGLASISGTASVAFTNTGNLQETESPPVRGGGALYDYYEEHRRRRQRELEEIEERERETRDIQDALDRQIAEQFRAQELLAAKRAEAVRLARLAELFAQRPLELPPHVMQAIQAAAERKSYALLLQMQREIERMYQEEEAAVLAALLLDED